MERNLILSMLLDELIEDDVLTFNSSSDESDDDLVAIAAVIASELPQPRIAMTNYCENVVAAYSDSTFVQHFRIKRELVSCITQQFAQSQLFTALGQETSRSITAEKHILVFLWFAGHQTASFRDVADRFDLSLSSLHDIISRVMSFLVSLSDQVFKFPTLEEKKRTKTYYRAAGSLPGAVAAIGVSHIKIDTPSTRAPDYLNRNHYYSILLQAVCNEEGRFLDLCAGFPGSVHDAHVFRQSAFSQKIYQLCGNYEYVLGGSAYPLLPVLMTPFRDNGHLTRAQRRYNERLSKARISIEHALGRLKQRFRKLYHLKLRGCQRITTFIVACCVLHNLALDDELQFQEAENDNQPDHETALPISNQQGNVVRGNICKSFI